MARIIFPSFHYERDAWRAGVVRNSWRTQGFKASGFRDGARWEQVERHGKEAVERWIEDQLKGASVTIVLIGAQTAEREWVMHEIRRSCALRMGLVGIRIHGIRNNHRLVDVAGANPFDSLWYDSPGGVRQYLSSIYSTYDYVADNGYQNLGAWIEAAARAAGR